MEPLTADTDFDEGSREQIRKVVGLPKPLLLKSSLLLILACLHPGYPQPLQWMLLFIHLISCWAWTELDIVKPIPKCPDKYLVPPTDRPHWRKGVLVDAILAVATPKKDLEEQGSVCPFNRVQSNGQVWKAGVFHSYFHLLGLLLTLHSLIGFRQIWRKNLNSEPMSAEDFKGLILNWPLS